MFRRTALVLLSIPLLACATPRQTPPIAAPVLVPGPSETVAVDQLVLLIDASSSVTENTLFQDQKALVESFARSMPDGRYETSAIVFGGFRRENIAPASFDRARIVRETSQISHLAEGTPIHRAIAEAEQQLAGRAGRAAVVLYSDGLLTDEIGRDLDPQLALDAAAQLAESHGGRVCFHTVQTGSDPAGTELLRQLADASDCGSFRRVDGVTTVALLQQFEREVFLAAAPAVAAAPRDTDRDGVLDDNDLCPGTPLGAAVDDRGCWVVKGLLFAVDSAAISATGRQGLDEVVAVLRQNPALRVRIEGHTDSTGSEAHNLGLSNRRAETARSYLVSAGIDASRLEAKGFGQSNPAADNSTDEGRQANRRTEISIVR